MASSNSSTTFKIWIRRGYSFISLVALCLSPFVISSFIIAHDDDHFHEYPLPPIGQSEDELEKKLEDKQKQIQELEQKISETQNTARTLNGQIAYMDNQIKLTELNIIKTENNIEQLAEEIDKLSNQISYLNTNLDQIATLLTQRIRATYMHGDVTPLGMFLSNQGFGSMFNQVKYLQTVQLHDRQLLLAMEQTKSTYEQRRDLKEEKQLELDQMQDQLEVQKLQLDQQKVGKQALLESTKNDEKRYQQLLAAAQAEQAAIQSAIAQAIKFLEDGTPINQGDKIALMGNSGAEGGCSTAAHLHFEVTDKKGNHMNPANYLKSSWPITWDNAPDSPLSLIGDWDWPMKNPRVTQGYGYTHWAKSGFYSGRPHTGIDMVDSQDIVIRAPKSGKLHKGTASCRGKPMNYVAVEHDEVISWYWHVQ